MSEREGERDGGREGEEERGRKRERGRGREGQVAQSFSSIEAIPNVIYIVVSKSTAYVIVLYFINS